MAERASVRVVTGGEPEAEAAAPPVAAAHPPQDDAATAPEAQPPITTPPVDEPPEPTIGGEAVTPLSADQLVAAAGGSVADRLRARFQQIQSTEEFPVPGWELEDGRPGLIVVARTFGDRKAFNQGVTNEVYIARSTHKLLFVNDDGTREEIEGGWGPKLAEMMGVPVTKAADLVALVISKPDPDNPDTRIPNVAGIGALAMQIVAWAGRGSREAEEDLGG